MAKVISAVREISIPEQGGEVGYTFHVVEQIGDFDGRYYYSLPDEFYNRFMEHEQEDGVDLKEHTPEDLVDIRGKLSTYKFINSTVAEKIREKYRIEDEIKALNTGDADYKVYRQKCIDEGNEKKIALGLKPESSKANVKTKKKKTKTSPA